MEPEKLKRGKGFHKKIQFEWEVEVKDGIPISEKTITRSNGRKGRMDVIVEELGDYVSIIEIKNTNWEKIKNENIKKNINRQSKQIWTYIEKYINEGIDVCPGIIFPIKPKDSKLLSFIEEQFQENCISIVWDDETILETKKRNLTTAST